MEMKHGWNPRVFLLGLMVLALWSSPALAARTAIGGFQIDLDPPEPYPGEPYPAIFYNNSTVGWSFVPSADIEVQSLGFYDHGADGLARSHDIGIWASDGTLVSRTLLEGIHGPYSVEPAPETVLIGHYQHAAVDPVVLKAGEVYVIGATLLAPDDFDDGGEFDVAPTRVQEGTLVVDPIIQLADTGLYHPGDPYITLQATAALIDTLEAPEGWGPLRFPSDVYLSQEHFAANFAFEVVPEPSVAVLLVAGGALLRRRRERRLGA